MPKYIAHGTVVKINSITIGGLVSVSLPSRSKGEAEVTNSASGNWREFIAGLRDPGEMELTYRHDPDDAGQQELEDNFALAPGSEIVEIQIILPNAATAGAGSRTYTFDGYVMNAPTGDLNTADDEAAELSTTIRVAGAVSITT